MQIVNTNLIRSRYPFIVSENNDEFSGTVIKIFSKQLDIINPNKYEIIYEHSGIQVSNNHNQYENENEIVKHHIIKLNNEWCIPLNYVFCLKNDEMLHTYSKCLSSDCINQTECMENAMNIYTDCIVFCCPWSDGFQHCTQDLIPRIIACKDWLKQNIGVSLLLPYNPHLFWWLNMYINDIKNNIIFTHASYVKAYDTNINIYTDMITPLHRCEMVPYSLYLNMNIINKNVVDKYIIVFDRSKCSTRVIDNTKLLKIIQPYATKYNLELLILNPDNIDKNKLVDYMKECRGVIAPHGGANYNVLFMRRTENIIDKHRFFIELVANKYLHHTYHIALGSKINYKAILCNGSHYEYTLDFDEIDVINALNLFFN